MNTLRYIFFCSLIIWVIVLRSKTFSEYLKLVITIWLWKTCPNAWQENCTTCLTYHNATVFRMIRSSIFFHGRKTTCAIYTVIVHIYLCCFVQNELKYFGLVRSTLFRYTQYCMSNWESLWQSCYSNLQLILCQGCCLICAHRCQMTLRATLAMKEVLLHDDRHIMAVISTLKFVICKKVFFSKIEAFIYNIIAMVRYDLSTTELVIFWISEHGMPFAADEI